VIFGGDTPTSVTGYDLHVNFSSEVEACGTQMSTCEHCVDAMACIGVAELVTHARRLLGMAVG
jgi:hypothetical protein